MNANDQFQFTPEDLSRIEEQLQRGTLEYSVNTMKIIRAMLADLKLARLKLQNAYQSNAEMANLIHQMEMTAVIFRGK